MGLTIETAACAGVTTYCTYGELAAFLLVAAAVAEPASYRAGS